MHNHKIGSSFWIFFSSVFLVNCDPEGPQVTLGTGTILGMVDHSYNGRPFYAFKGIPYGQPPVDRLRFKPSKPVEKWEGILQVTEHGPLCAQSALGFTGGSEDCLHLSVYTPKLPDQDKSNIDKMPVVVWLHGGAFVTGGSAFYDPWLLMDRDLVIVVPQYRLGLLGFLATYTPHAPGNNGVLDQVIALKWVQNNIGSFGGDPSKVTLGGDCAGGASAIYHMISPVSKGLFQRAISFSGTALSPWALFSYARRLIIMVANYIVCPAHDMQLMVKCFQEVTLEELQEAQQMYLEAKDPLVGNDKIAPHVTDKALGLENEEERFLPIHPLEALAFGDFTKVPLILEVTEDVGSYMMDMSFYDFVKFQLEKNSEYTKILVQEILRAMYIQNPENYTDKMKDYYFPNMTFEVLDPLVPGLSKMLGDILYTSSIFETAKLFSDQIPTRLFRFGYKGGPKLFNLRHPDPEAAPPVSPDAVSLGDELFFFFPENRTVLRDEQLMISKYILDMIENFAYEQFKETFENCQYYKSYTIFCYYLAILLSQQFPASGGGEHHQREEREKKEIEEPLKGWSTFTKSRHETLIMTEDGNLDFNRPFYDEERTGMLDYTFGLLHKNIIEKIKKDRRHDEL